MKLQAPSISNYQLLISLIPSIHHPISMDSFETNPRCLIISFIAISVYIYKK